ncbi:hypothetical protein BCR39DRAFT_571085 [Naematelia encephala]|uniref:Uncharacterized protein n=1 Tax=Naematelia encephala TaxID=71784 RepID=A0A1Y2BAP6_9TREE|nr:hypothetical protein BCR39DRAFT_571085 [Naematelia encephala]
MSQFLSGALDCAPQNALKTVSGRFELDRSLYQDRLVSTPNVAGPSSRPFGRNEPQRPLYANATQAPFDLSSLRQHLSPPPPLQQHRSSTPTASAPWVDGFVSRPPPAARVSSPWQADFDQHLRASSSSSIRHVAQDQQRVAVSPQPYLAPWQRAAYQPHPGPHFQHPFDPPFFQPQPYSSALQSQPLRPATAPPNQQTTIAPSEPLDESQHLLARTARSFVADLESSEGLLAENPKLAESKFMALLHGLGAEKVVVQEGAQSGSEEIGRGAEFVQRGTGTELDWASDFLGVKNESGPSTTVQTPINTNRYFNPQGGAVQVGAPESMSEWEQQFQDQEAVLMSDQYRPGSMTQRRKSVHFSDDATESLGNGVPTNLEDALGSSTSIPGAQTSWEEDGLLDDLDEEAFMNFNGELRQAHDHRLGIGALEGWGELQQDWEEFQRAQPGTAGLRGMGRGDEQERYLFQAGNPYVSMYESPQARSESPTVKASTSTYGVLELEASVQDDPTDHLAWFNLGLKQQENEREDQAILALSKVVQLDPEYRPAYLALAVSYTNEGEYEAANTMLGRWIDLASPDSNSNSLRGDIRNAETTGWADGQKMLVQRLIDLARLSPHQVDPDTQVALGVLFNSSEDYSKAEDCFLAALSARPDDWLVWNRLGATLANSGRSSEAVTYYHKALSLHPNFVRALFNLGISYINLAQYSLAAQSILDALRLQHADASEGYSTSGSRMSVKAARGVGSETLWNTLRSACLHMGRHDLVELASKRELGGKWREPI